MRNLQLYIFILYTIIVNLELNSQTLNLNKPIINDDVIFEEKDGFISVEAEYFLNQYKTEIRQWYRTSKNELVKVGRDDDDTHCIGASNNAYIEILPDTRVTHSDELIHGENFSNQPGKLAILSYKIKFNNSGRYYVWVRAMSTGGEDNGIHVGLNNEWPNHGQRMQWCKGKNKWTWGSKQRTKEIHCGIPHAIYLDIDSPGIHDVQFSMREDGFEFDKFILTQDINYIPSNKNQEVFLAQGFLPNPFPSCNSNEEKGSYFKRISNSNSENRVIPAQQFPTEGTNFYKNGKNWLAINPKKHQEAETTTTFNFENGNYDIVFVGVAENDGNSNFKLLLNDIEIGSYAVPLTHYLFEEGSKYNAVWKNIKLNKGDRITVKAKVATDGNEWTRGRWAGLIFTPVGNGLQILNAPSSYTSE